MKPKLQVQTELSAPAFVATYRTKLDALAAQGVVKTWSGWQCYFAAMHGSMPSEAATRLYLAEYNKLVDLENKGATTP